MHGYCTIYNRPHCCTVYNVVYSTLCNASGLCYYISMINKTRTNKQTVYNKRFTTNKRLYITFYNKPTKRLYYYNNYIKPALYAIVSIPILYITVLLYTI